MGSMLARVFFVPSAALAFRPGFPLTSQQIENALEQRVGFEPTGFQLCRLLHWATLPPLHCLDLTSGIEPADSIPACTQVSNPLCLLSRVFAVAALLQKRVLFGGCRRNRTYLTLREHRVYSLGTGTRNYWHSYHYELSR
jgi:hypothetical protein